MKKYIVVGYLNGSDNEKYLNIKYFDDLIGVYQFVCRQIVYGDQDIEDLMADDELEESFKDNSTDYYIFENGMEDPIISIECDNISKSLWKKFENFCFKNDESIQVRKYSEFIFEGKNKFPNIKKIDVDGFVVYVGKDAISNDHLTFNMSHPEDIWMHSKGVPGSHVIIRVRENLPTKELLKKVAEITVKNSKPKSDKTTVVYCQRKFVKKEKGMNPGQVKVDYLNAEEITLKNNIYTTKIIIK
jgi:hypothetical protein